MFVDIIQNRRDPNGRLAFIRAESKRWGTVSMPAYFPRDSQTTTPLGKLEVMITGLLYHKMDNGMNDWDRAPKCVFIREPSPDEGDHKIWYRGFECSGSMCTTTTSGFAIDGFIPFPTLAAKRKNKKLWKCEDGVERSDDHFISFITPGRLQDWIITADNVNTSFTNRAPLTHGIGWCRYNKDKGIYRLEGVESLINLNAFTKVLEN